MEVIIAIGVIALLIYLFSPAKKTTEKTKPKTNTTPIGNQQNYKTSWRPHYKKCPVPTKSDHEIIRSRFQNHPLVRMIENDLSQNNMIDYDYSRGGIRVYRDRVVTKSKTYKYSDHGLSALDMESCWMLACWLGDYMPAGGDFTIRTIYEEYYSSGSTYYYETPSGHLVSGDTSSGGERRVGYMVFKTDTKNNKPTQNMNW